MKRTPALNPQPQKSVGRTVSLTCPHCQHVQQIRPDGISIFCWKCHQLIDIQNALHPKPQSPKAAVSTVPLHCPHCHEEQQVQPDILSIFCRKCHNPIDIQHTLHPPTPSEAKATEVKNSTCFRCQAELTTPAKALSMLCKKCGYRNDLQDYHVKGVLSRDLETRGSLHIAGGGTVLNSKALVKEAIIQGKFIGRLTAQDSITLKSGAIFEGGLKTPILILESNVQCSIKKEFLVKRIVISGQYRGNIQTSQYVELKKTACFVGSMTTRNLILEEGASLVGELKVGLIPSEAIAI